MDLLLTDALIVTCDATRKILPHAAIAVRGTRIVALGPTATLESDPALADLPRMDGRGLARAARPDQRPTPTPCCSRCAARWRIGRGKRSIATCRPSPTR